MVNATLYLFRYNNYYNRIVKKEETIDNYLALEQPIESDDGIIESQVKMLYKLENVNFIPNDYVNATQVVNYEGEEPDYLIVVDEEGNINSRWFILQTTRIRAGQTELALRRDLVVDYNDDFMNSDCFIEKGTPINFDDPAIFNKEDMGFNQIKQEEYLLKDKSNCAWIVGYIPSDSFPEAGESLTTSYSYLGYENYEYPDLSDYPFYKYSTDAGGYCEYAENTMLKFHTIVLKSYADKYSFLQIPDWCDLTVSSRAGSYRGYDLKTSGQYGKGYNGNSSLGIMGLDIVWGRDTSVYKYQTKEEAIEGAKEKFTDSYTGSNTTKYIGDTDSFYFNSQIDDLASSIIKKYGMVNLLLAENDAQYLLTSVEQQNDAGKILQEDGKIIFNTTDNNYYRIRVNTISTENEKSAYVPVDSKPYATLVNNILYKQDEDGQYTIADGNLRYIGSGSKGSQSSTKTHDCASFICGAPNSRTFEITGNVKRIEISFELLSSNIEATIPPVDERYHLNDSPYDMFCIPFPSEGQSFDVYRNSEIFISNVDRLAGLNFASKLAATAGSGNQYDVQLLPYFPMQNVLEESDYFDIKGITVSPITTYTINKQNNEKENEKTSSLIIWCYSSEFKVNIPFPIPKATSIEERKIRNETEIWRLCSPNYSGVFEFSPEKNDGVDEIIVDCNYKPFAPYIHARINFKNLYGWRDFNDSRGLICGGDFSLPQVTSAWADYALNNKNYQQMFDRGIQNMEINNAVQREKEKWQLAAGVMQGTAQGMSLGSSSLMGMGGGMSGGIGTVVGGVGGGLFSYFAGKRDIELNNKLREEGIDYSKDMFGYQLGNIQALPQGLAKVSAYTANNKIFPFLEKYGCTDIEVQALKNKLKYNGYTIMRIGSFSEFLGDSGQIDEESGEIKRTYVKGKLIRLPISMQGDYHIGVELASELNKGVFI